LTMIISSAEKTVAKTKVQRKIKRAIIGINIFPLMT
jgi:hypothetical protein